MEEIFKNIDEYEGHYQVSNMGNIKSLKFNKEKILAPAKTKSGYLYINLCKNNITKKIKIHRLVLLTFNLKNKFDYKQINHIDGNKLNNSLDNLEWCTQSENMKHADDIGLRNIKGVNNSSSKLNYKQVRIIRLAYKNKYFTQKELAKIFNITQPNISEIVLNKLWNY